jgi:hypothetical protein
MATKDIANYAYIWFNNQPDKPITDFLDTEKEFIHDIITKGTFPTYLKEYSPDEKVELLANEIEFVRNKFIEKGFSNITIQQIPRILYDLFNLLFYYHANPKLTPVPLDKFIIKYRCETENERINTDTLENYISYTIQNIENFKDKIFELNDRIIYFIIAYGINPTDIAENYTNILNWIMIDIQKIPPYFRQHYSSVIDTQLNMEIFEVILEFEKSPANNSILLYRVADFPNDSTIDATREDKINQFSLSQNLSILSGFMGDTAACTLMRFVESGRDKIKYTIKKFILGDKSDEDALFFIPPIPPYLQLYCNGELWHPRTKIGNDLLSEERKMKGLLCHRRIDFNKELTYLTSYKKMDELQDIYQSYITHQNITTWEKKYLKYKTKYLELKYQLGM